nr:MAG TPA: hypothetical protein [Caudoviricetes sp.]
MFRNLCLFYYLLFLEEEFLYETNKQQTTYR